MTLLNMTHPFSIHCLVILLIICLLSAERTVTRIALLNVTPCLIIFVTMGLNSPLFRA
jgi:flagellar biosynthesis protein FliQ